MLAHSIFSPLFGTDSGWTWALAIVMLTVVIRTALIPLFVKQIKSSRSMQLLQPKVRELQKKYGHDREKLGQETMKLYRENNANPLASCLPLLLQMPIFLALFRVLDGVSRTNDAGDPLVRGHWLKIHPELVDSLNQATIFGARLSDTFLKVPFTNGITSVHVVTVVLIIAMTITLFITQLQLMRKNMPPEALTGPFAQQQKIMLYAFPLIFAIGGINFPVGVLIYWFTSNLWTMGQQFYVIRRNPAPALRRTRRGRSAARRGRSVMAARSRTVGRMGPPRWRRCRAVVVRLRPPQQARPRPASFGSSRVNRPARSASAERNPGRVYALERKGME